jgi:hypothetical protein
MLGRDYPALTPKYMMHPSLSSTGPRATTTPTNSNAIIAMFSGSKTASDYFHVAQKHYEARNPKSKSQHEVAARHLPGGNTRSVLHGSPFPLSMASGRGNRVIDLDGHEFVAACPDDRITIDSLGTLI